MVSLYMSEVLYAPKEVFSLFTNLNHKVGGVSQYCSSFLSNNLSQSYHYALPMSLFEYELRLGTPAINVTTFEELLHHSRHSPRSEIILTPINSDAVDMLNNYLTQNNLQMPANWIVSMSKDFFQN